MDQPFPTSGSDSASIAQPAGAAAPAPSTRSFSSAETGAGESLAEMASRDLDAALQLLAERAQYITDATGAAIALRRGDHHDMLCRASTGSTAPELGALLSMDYGLSGESLRTRQVQRCDDAQNDARVNREACRHLGIASVVVMPILSGGQALGVFELFSGKPRAFEERDVSALQRLGSMVELAIRFAVAAQSNASEDASPQAVHSATAPFEMREIEEAPARSEPALVAPQSAPVAPLIDLAPAANAESSATEQPFLASNQPGNVIPAPALSIEKPALEETDQKKDAAPIDLENADQKTQEQIKEDHKKEDHRKEDQKNAPDNVNLKIESPKPKLEPSPKKPLFWSATQLDRPLPAESAAAPSNSIPPTLRKLKQCQACGFPISQDRILCVECEEKQWRGQSLSQKQGATAQPAKSKMVATSAKNDLVSAKGSLIPPSGSAQPEPASARSASPDSGSPQLKTEQSAHAAPHKQSAAEPAVPDPLAQPSVAIAGPRDLTQVKANVAAGTSVAETSAPFFSLTLQSESWFAANKYIIAALLLVAIVLAIFAILR